MVQIEDKYKRWRGFYQFNSSYFWEVWLERNKISCCGLENNVEATWNRIINYSLAQVMVVL